MAVCRPPRAPARRASSPVTLRNASGRIIEAVSIGEAVTLEVEAAVEQAIPRLILGFMIKDQHGQPIYGINTHRLDMALEDLQAGERVGFRFAFETILGKGHYSVAIALSAYDSHLDKNYAVARSQPDLPRSQSRQGGLRRLDLARRQGCSGKNQHMTRPLRVVLNANIMLAPLTGIGQYVGELGHALLQRDDVQLSFTYGLRYGHSLPHQGLRNYSLLRDLAKRVLPKPYQAKRWVERRVLSRALRVEGADLYHEPSLWPQRVAHPMVFTLHDLTHVHYPQTQPADRLRAIEQTLDQAVESAPQDPGPVSETHCAAGHATLWPARRTPVYYATGRFSPFSNPAVQNSHLSCCVH